MSVKNNRGRLGMSIHPLSYFTGENRVTPFENELCYDDETYDIYIFHQNEEGGNWEPKSRTKDIQEYLDDLEKSGVFTSAAAFVNNRKIYRFYFDQANGVVRLDPELRFENIYRYYAIRKTELTPEGGYIYITGAKDVRPDGDVVNSSLVDMELVPSESGDGTFVSKPMIGGLVEEVTGGNTYVVEFFDENRQLVNMQTYQAISVRTADLDLSPDTAVVDMYIQSNQSYTEEDSIYLYRGQKMSSVQISTMLKYADGLTRDVSFEEKVGGRLAILGVDEITSEEVTGPDDDPQTIQVVYTMIRSNASLPPSTETTESGAVISPSSLTISKYIKVYVIEDTENLIERIIPAGWIEKKPGGQAIIHMKYFAYYSSGVVHDITSVTQYVGQPLIENSLTTQHLKVQVPHGNAGNYKTLSFTISPKAHSDLSVNTVPVTIGAEPRQSLFTTFDNTITAGTNHSGKFINFQIADPSGEGYQATTLSTLATQPEAIFNDRRPTHVRIRDVKDSSYIYTDLVNVTNDSGIFYDVYGASGHEMKKDRVLLLEFFDIGETVGQIATSVFSTGAMVIYAKPNKG